MPLFNERLAIMREVGAILCNVSFPPCVYMHADLWTHVNLQNDFGGSYLGFLKAFQRRHENQGTALDLVQYVTDTFPSFRDERMLNGRRGKSISILTPDWRLSIVKD